jgi:hypothetical protein
MLARKSQDLVNSELVLADGAQADREPAPRVASRACERRISGFMGRREYGMYRKMKTEDINGPPGAEAGR